MEEELSDISNNNINYNEIDPLNDPALDFD